MRPLLASLVFFVNGLSPASALEWLPVIDSQFLMGQVFQGGEATSWQGNVSLQMTPAVKFSESFGLIPTYAGAYQGTRSVTDLGGGGVLFQDSQNHTASLKAIWRVGERWKIKPSISHRWEFLRETTDEDWGRGLFDYRKPAAGLEVEFAPVEKVKTFASYDFYKILFPNYSSLESRAGSLGREQAEARTLDSVNHAWTTGGTFPLPLQGSWGKLTASLTDRQNRDQHIVVASGNLTAETRKDDIKAVQANVYYGKAFDRRIGVLGTFGYGFTRYRSNQNHYDAELNVFNRDFYSYEERSMQPGVTLVLGQRKVEWSFSYLRIERDFINRRAQSSGGSYLNETVLLKQDSFLFDLGIPVKNGFKIMARAGITRSRSNNTYEKTFRHNYTLSNHLVGFSWSY